MGAMTVQRRRLSMMALLALAIAATSGCPAPGGTLGGPAAA